MILIDMKMPQRCGQCPCFHAETQMYCQAVKPSKEKQIIAPYGLNRPDWCPLRKLDEDVLSTRRKGYWKDECSCSVCNWIHEDDHGFALLTDYNFCPNCGADMRGRTNG